MDGALVLSEPLHLKAWERYLENNSFEKPDFLTLDKVTGLSDIKLALDLKSVCGIESSPDEMCNEKEKIYLEVINETQAGVLPGRDEFLQYCKGNFITAVVSSSSNEEVTRTLNSQGISAYFQFIITRNDTKDHKPHPAPYLLALEKAGVKASEAMAIEDSAHGIEALINAGIKPFALKSGGIAKETFPNVDFFDDFIQIKKALKL
jgi:HAD superfamily hydrolase (TIGR01509 family)